MFPRSSSLLPLSKTLHKRAPLTRLLCQTLLSRPSFTLLLHSTSMSQMFRRLVASFSSHGQLYRGCIDTYYLAEPCARLSRFCPSANHILGAARPRRHWNHRYPKVNQEERTIGQACRHHFEFRCHCQPQQRQLAWSHLHRSRL